MTSSPDFSQHNYCTRCESWYARPRSCNCFDADGREIPRESAPVLPVLPYTPPPTIVPLPWIQPNPIFPYPTWGPYRPTLTPVQPYPGTIIWSVDGASSITTGGINTQVES